MGTWFLKMESPSTILHQMQTTGCSVSIQNSCINRRYLSNWMCFNKHCHESCV